MEASRLNYRPYFRGQEFSNAFIRAVALVLVCLVGCDSGAEPGSAKALNSSENSENLVTVKIQFAGQGPADTVDSIACNPDSTVLDMLMAACQLRGLSVAKRGAGETAFVSEIGGVANQRSQGDNWIFTVNGELAERSCGAFGVIAGDSITWQFGEYQPEPSRQENLNQK